MSIGLFVDGAFLSICWNSIAPGRQIDYKAFRSRIESELDDSIVEAYCFDATDDALPSARFRAMEHAGIRVKLYGYSSEALYGQERQPLIDPTTHCQARRKVQKGVDVGLAIHMLDSYQRRRWNRLVLVASDADFAELVQRLVEQHNVELITLGNPTRTSHSLVPYASRLLDLATLAPDLVRNVVNIREARPALSQEPYLVTKGTGAGPS